MAALAAGFVTVLVACEGPAKAGGGSGSGGGAPADAPRRANAGTESDSGSSPADAVKRGEYLVTITACGDCHTPMKMGEKGPEPDLSKFLSGHPQDAALPPPPGPSGPWVWHGTGTNTAFAGPWGITYAMNLTPHTHGMAAWTEDMFVRAMRTGKHMGESRPIMPPMPWQNAGKMTDEDLKAVYAYLKSIPPVNNVVPDYQPPKKGK
jgi:mono/diheme cytochrome c family protein